MNITIKVVSLFFIASIIINTAECQVSQEWVKRYNGTLNLADVPVRVLVDKQGNVIVAGTTNTQSNSDFIIMKYNSAGDTLWKRTYGFSVSPVSQDYARWAVLDDSGNVYVTGYTENGGPASFQTVKCSSGGVIQWIKRLSPGYYARPNDIMYQNGFVYVTGEHIPQANYPEITFTIKYNALTGDTLWTRKFGGFNYYRGYGKKLAGEGAGDIYVGLIGSNSAFPVALGLIKYNASGDSVLVNFSDTTARIGILNAMKRDDQGNFYITGMGGYTGQDIATVKLNSSGALQWRKYYGSSTADDNAYALEIDPSGGIYVAGYTWVNNNDFRDFLTIKYNSNGDTAWTRRYSSVNPRYNDVANSIALDNTGNIYVTGVGAVSTLQNEFVTVKYSSAGLQQWVIKYRSPSNINDRAVSVAVDSLSNVFVTGYGANSTASDDLDIVTIKYLQNPTGITGYNVPSVFKLYQNYPNPFNPKCKIDFQLPQDGIVTLKIFDVLGREVVTLLNEFRNAEYYSVEFDGSDLASGVYFYRIEAGEFNGIKKLVLLK